MSEVKDLYICCVFSSKVKKHWSFCVFFCQFLSLLDGLQTCDTSYFVDDCYFICKPTANATLYVFLGIAWTSSSYWHRGFWITEGVCPTENVRQGKALSTDTEIVGLWKREWSEMQNKHYSYFFCEILKGDLTALIITRQSSFLFWNSVNDEERSRKKLDPYRW